MSERPNLNFLVRGPVFRYVEKLEARLTAYERQAEKNARQAEKNAKVSQGRFDEASRFLNRAVKAESRLAAYERVAEPTLRRIANDNGERAVVRGIKEGGAYAKAIAFDEVRELARAALSALDTEEKS